MFSDERFSIVVKNDSKQHVYACVWSADGPSHCRQQSTDVTGTWLHLCLHRVSTFGRLNRFLSFLLNWNII